MLVPLKPNLNGTSKKPIKINDLLDSTGCLSRLNRRNKGQGSKKPNEINACSLVPLVPLKGVAGADKPRHPSVVTYAEWDKEGNKGHKRKDSLSDRWSGQQRLARYLKEDIAGGAVGTA